jgi:hypothetical protein
MTATEVKAQFIAELQALLDSWGAEIEAADFFWGSDICIQITIPAIYDGNGREERELVCFDVGQSMSAKK